LTFGHSGAQDLTPECQNVKKVKKGWLDYMALNAVLDVFLPQSEKVWD